MHIEFKNDVKLLRFFLILIASVIIVKFFWNDGLSFLNQAFSPLIMAAVVIYLLDPLVDLLCRKTKLSRQASVIISYIALVLFMVLFVLMIVPSLVDSIKALIANLGSYDENTIITFLHKVPLIENYIDISSLESIFANIEGFIVDYSSDILNYSTNILSSIGSILWSIVMFLMALFMAFFALKDTDHLGKKLENVLVAYLPESVKDRIIRVINLTDKAIKRYLVSKLYTCVILGLLVLICVLLVNWLTPFYIPYAPLMAFVIGLSNLIPYVGWIIAAPAILLAFLAGIWEGVILIGIIFLTQQIDNLIISPKVIGDHMSMNPFWIIVSITIGGSLFGVIGMIIAIPIVSVILKLVDERVERHKASHILQDDSILEEEGLDIDEPDDDSLIK